MSYPNNLNVIQQLFFPSTHIGASCTSNIKCTQCMRKHHLAICDAHLESTVSESPTQANNIKTDTGIRQPAPNSSSSLEISGTKVNEYVIGYAGEHSPNMNEVILVQTAQAKVYSPVESALSAKIRVLLDLGSQRSYITKKLAESLALACLGKETVLIKTFGDQTGKLVTCDIVQVQVQCNDGLSLFIKCYVVDFVYSPITNQYIEFSQANYSHLIWLHLADMATGETGLDIDLLIGADQYHSIVLGQTIPSDTGRGPTATLTRLGYTLSGPIDLPANFSHVNTSLNVTHFMQIESSPMKTKPIEEFYENCLWDYETLGIKPAEPPPSMKPFWTQLTLLTEDMKSHYLSKRES